MAKPIQYCKVKKNNNKLIKNNKILKIEMYLAYNIILVSGKQHSEMTCIHCEIVITINLDMICHLTELIQCYSLYFPCHTLYLMTYFITEILYSVASPPLATPKPYSPLATTNLFSYILFSILLFFVVLHIPLISEIIWYIFFSV